MGWSGASEIMDEIIKVIQPEIPDEKKMGTPVR